MNLQNQLDSHSRRVFCERWAKTALGVTVLHGTAGSLLAAETAAAATPATGPGFGKAKNIIFMQKIGGMTHIDSTDQNEGRLPAWRHDGKSRQTSR
ncbi:MAG: hypothetical protein NTX35_19540 [Verrucomicrobia bacterium]|nr:hypothetical protein [Verrucomicrobiota bacterium]